ncbi:fatty acyl-CoA hydrolase precursor, medium chain-like isoform X2 [Pseudophryne corroboree]|uniref:fatty acyl-CoA hydrolase precursor, medium chain-like isoform X2 n=1 Tax=Pseudophryne corroboree TaxID=495146 RepID=UPI00308153FC
MGALMRGIILYSLILGALAAGQEEDRPLVVTQYGKLRGKTVAVKETDRTVHAFYGIPFAKPPVGPLRLASPEPPEPWGFVREATEQPPMCLQTVEIAEQLMKTFKVRITLPPVSEDCLYLNIFSPADREQNTRLPVMVFIHGGGLVMGAAMMFEGVALSAYENVVVVSIQYRLGLMGFLSSGDEQLPGNYGFFDQVQALRWVQGNIVDFGGDPNSVTIFGESAGGISVSALVVSPLAKGLFHRAIAESGVATMPGLIANSDEEVIFIRNVVANVTGCDQNKMLDCFMAKTEEEIIAISSVLKFLTLPGSVDGSFFPKSAVQIMADKESNRVPFLTGVTDQEFGWILPVVMNISGLREGMDRETAQEVIKSNPLLGMWSGVIPLLLDEYLGDTDDRAEIRNRFLDLCGDFIFVMPALKAANYHRDAGNPVYFYEFQRRPSFFKDSKPDFVKADHGDELFFVIGGPFLTGDLLFTGAAEEEEKALSKTIMKYWANFARTGNPNGPGLTHWPQYGQDEGYLKINLEQASATGLKADKYKFWTTTIPERLQELQKTGEAHSEL